MAKAKALTGDNRWKAEHDLNTLIEAEKIRADDKRMKAAMEMRKEMKEALNQVVED